MSKHGKILVAMSGGIDSTVAAAMLHEQGYQVVGITMKTWDYASSGASTKETGCCSLDSLQDARRVAVDMGFHHFILDIRDEFGDAVIENFVEEYIAGRTPNPCVLCNTHIKWNALLKRADGLDCEFIATGHYARVHQLDDRYYISKAKDLHKDQSYVLWGLSQEAMCRSRFPLSELLKSEVRKMASDMGYDNLAKKAESYEICFVPDNDYRAFLKRRVDGLEDKVEGGYFINARGELLGRHHGYPFYTIGQRKGLGVAFGKPMFVTDIYPETNTVVLGDEEDLSRQGMTVGKLNWHKYDHIPEEIELITKIRYKDAGHLSAVQHINGQLNVQFSSRVKGIAPGQSAVVYDGEDLVCGGIIASSLQNIPLA
ncbi:MAG: tRNA 2-thiouridine(34) synthase MnmA [Saprospiraceae bacterium]|nr:tRNA 2-thiouridine(34) synthase MnmA [Saprospiraceae bacterium]HMW39176.1 tRNA 2-thiouridine(34) synthase MnmA [Saprospiraceae bacterium]HMX89441.1 tRNA 2-thiouridine(34) synthase MnmA [Saprospiraceae bacterium]HMZ41259.1 tRNA 2-thiouridine(34) synthase MnmA [Saprospiraceae bacterium]HNA65923.1 tRNA 2-thiouridine(34) synthase MnmA [Saprospiraceae bacterium]